MEFNQGFGDMGVGIAHHFSSGVYAKETVIPKGTQLYQHKHPFDHLSILASGTVLVEQFGAESKTFTGPACLTIAAGIEHAVTALTDAVWFCVHATDCTDPDKIDHVLTQHDPN